MSKKKFKDTKLGQFLTSKGSDIVGLVGDTLPNQGLGDIAPAEVK